MSIIGEHFEYMCRGHVSETKHKIFLSHSGAQKNFVADLYADLMRCDRHPFFDRSRSSLPIGDKFPNLIFEAIEQCEVGVVVLFEEFLQGVSGQCWSWWLWLKNQRNRMEGYKSFLYFIAFLVVGVMILLSKLSG
jgi:hypothetical protein